VTARVEFTPKTGAKIRRTPRGKEFGAFKHSPNVPVFKIVRFDQEKFLAARGGRTKG
jgi:hypothetical protein